MLGIQIEEAKKKEAYISSEFYRLFKNAILLGLTYEETKCMFNEVIPEFPAAKGKADLVVFHSDYGGTAEPFLLIEIKVRAYERPGPSVAAAVRRAKSYAESLNMLPGHFFATYDGWTFLVFRDIPPYLIGAYGEITKEKQIENLLKGLQEYAYKNKLDLLNSLPRPGDPEFLIKRILPSIAKLLATEPEQVSDLVNSWKQVLSRE
jgi:hypothetical protein